MEEKKKCLCGSSDVRVVACSGASNVGQIANQAAIELGQPEVAGFFCLAGVGGPYKRNGQISKRSGSDGGNRRVSGAMCCQDLAAC